MDDFFNFAEVLPEDQDDEALGDSADDFFNFSGNPTVSTAPQLPPAESGQVSSSPLPDPALLEDGISAEELAAMVAA